jgi:hypothetical protein
VSGNPAGRPRFSIVSIIKEQLQGIPAGEQRPLIESLIAEYVADARERKDGTAIRDLIDRFDGRAKQTVEVRDDRESAWDELTREMFVEPESKAAGDS